MITLACVPNQLQSLCTFRPPSVTSLSLDDIVAESCRMCHNEDEGIIGMNRPVEKMRVHNIREKKKDAGTCIPEIAIADEPTTCRLALEPLAKGSLRYIWLKRRY
jgi:hypothetical protein